MNESTSVDHKWLVKNSDTRPAPKCLTTSSQSTVDCPIQNHTNNDNSYKDPQGKGTLSRSEAKKLLNSMLLYMMMDTRYILSDVALQEIMDDEALLNLIMKNWINLSSMESILRSIFQQKKPEYGGYFGDFKFGNQEFLELIKKKLLDSTNVILGIEGTADKTLLREIQLIQIELEAYSNQPFIICLRSKHIYFF